MLVEWYLARKAKVAGEFYSLCAVLGFKTDVRCEHLELRDGQIATFVKSDKGMIGRCKYSWKNRPELESYSCDSTSDPIFGLKPRDSHFRSQCISERYPYDGTCDFWVVIPGRESEIKAAQIYVCDSVKSKVLHNIPTEFCVLMKLMLNSVAARSQVWTVFARSKTEIVGSNPAQGMDVCLCVYSVFVLFCV
jgi:hypothetical protein